MSENKDNIEIKDQVENTNIHETSEEIVEQVEVSEVKVPKERKPRKKKVVEEDLTIVNEEVSNETVEETIILEEEIIPEEVITPKKIKEKKFRRKYKRSKKNKEEKVVVRYETDPENGLSHEIVAERISDGLVNYQQIGSTKSKKRIIFSNLFTFFNILTMAIAGWLISVGALKDLMFVAIVSLNIILGIVQELRAKKTIDELSIIASPTADVLRNGNLSEIGINEIVLDDIISLETGKQICSDSIVVSGTVEVNESLLTGESDSIVKKIGDRLLSGSFIVSGKCKARVDAIGEDNYIEKLTQQAKKYKKPKSELLKTLNYIIKFMAIIIIPIGAFLFFMQYEKFWGTAAYSISVRKTAGAMIGMIPSGLYLLTSIALAVGVIKLKQNNVLVKELYCIEMLARVNVLCLDKTGTITDGTMKVKNVIEYNSIPGLSTKNIISAMLNATNDSNLTSSALEEMFGRGKRIKNKEVVPFSSQRKFSAVTFEKIGTFLLGAPEFVMKKNYRLIESDVANASSQGYRVLVVAHTQESIENGKIPDAELTPVVLILIEDTIRPDAIKTIKYFKDTGVEVKVISGDNPLTVSKISERAGIDRADEYISLDGLNDAEVSRAALKYTVFGRVSPDQKKLLVQVLKENEKIVAMTGDGVNDILALKEADCSIAVASGSDAARNVSHLVLLDSNFDSMPKVVGEGRRVINNVTKVACLFLTKTIFSLLLAIYALNRGGAYPISTNQLIMIDVLCIGVPSFVLILEPNDQRSGGKFFSNIIKGALPGAIVILINSILVFALANKLDMNEQISSTVIVVIATFTCMMVLFQTCRPFNTIKKGMYGILFTLFIFITLLLPKFLDFSPIAPIGDYYDSELKVETLKYTPSVSISQDDHYVINGIYTSHYNYSKNNNGFTVINKDGFIEVDGIIMEEFAVIPRVSYSLVSATKDKYVLEAVNTGIKKEKKNPEITMNTKGDIFLDGVDAKYNVLPTIKIKEGFFIINGEETNLTTHQAEITSLQIKNNQVYVNGTEIGYEVKNPLLSETDEGVFCLGGTEIGYYKDENPDIKVDENLFYVINGEITNSVFKTVVTISQKDFYVIDNQYSNTEVTSERMSFKLSTTSDGYLKINGQKTDYKVEIVYTIGGNVQRIPFETMLLTLLLCVISWPLMALLKGVIPWIKKQINFAIKIINKF